MTRSDFQEGNDISKAEVLKANVRFSHTIVHQLVYMSQILILY